MTEPLYKKAGRKYVPVVGTWYEDRCTDQMKVGTFRLVYCYSDGERRYEYEVTPAKAPDQIAPTVAMTIVPAPALYLTGWPFKMLLV